jgi:hypothetical protein
MLPATTQSGPAALAAPGARTKGVAPMASSHGNGSGGTDATPKGRKRSRHSHLRLVDCRLSPPPTREEIARACLQVALVAGGCSVDLGLDDGHGRYFAQFAEMLEEHAAKLAPNMNEEA